jgi:ferrochelatase
MSKTAVVLFNLGGPDSPAAVAPFLFNLFSDPAIISLPNPLRWLVARRIARRRAPVAQSIYAQIGGASPILGLTQDQAMALQNELNKSGAHRVFIAMRYWHPRAAAVVTEVKAWQPDRVVLLPLYPQYSTATSGSSLAEWDRLAKAAGLTAPSAAICCYPSAAGWIAAQVELIAKSLSAAAVHGRPRILFSAHGLPKIVIAKGDPYQWQVEQSAAATVEALARPDLDWTVCYQSRVGPLEWIGPSTGAEIDRAGRDGVPLVVVPIAFVSEHSETLVELDIEYAHRASRAGVPHYARVPAVATQPAFIAALAALVRGAGRQAPIQSESGGRICPVSCTACGQAR